MNLLGASRFILSSLFFFFCSFIPIKAATFARDAETELSVDPTGSSDGSGNFKPDGGGIFSFVHFANSSTGEDLDFGGRLKLDGKVYRQEEPSDQKSNVKVAIEGDLEGEQLEVTTSGISDSRKQEHDLSGTYRKLSDTELQQRAQQRYNAADAWLNEIYQQAKTNLAGSAFSDLKKREADWISYCDEFAERSAGINAPSEGLPEEVVRLQTLRDLTMSRIGFIRGLLDDSLPTGISAAYHDGYGGELDLEKDNKGVKFRLGVVRGPTASNGEVSGHVVLRNGSGTYRDPQPEEGEKAAEITFRILDDRRVEIKARNDGYLHGENAYFDGVYFKSGPLTESILLD
jgi:uncharacterized protein YecT (DUF1311 family)